MGGRSAPECADVAYSGGLRDDQGSLIQRRIRDRCEEHERCEDEGKLFHLSDFQIGLVVFVLTMRCRCCSRRMRDARIFRVRFCPKQKARSPSSAPSFATVAAGAGLGDDLGSLRKDRDGDRSKQNKGGGDRSNLGHFRFPQVFRGSLTMRCRVPCVWMRRDEFFRGFVFRIAVQTKARTLWPRSALSPEGAAREGKWRGAFQRARCPFVRCALRAPRTHSRK